MMPKGVKTGACPAGAAPPSTITREASPRSLRISADQRELRERDDIVPTPRPDEGGIARGGVSADADVVLHVAFELHAAEEWKAVELIGQPLPRDFFAVGRVGALHAPVERPREQVAPRQAVVADGGLDLCRRQGPVEPNR